MKKFFALLAIMAMCASMTNTPAFAQEDSLSQVEETLDAATDSIVELASEVTDAVEAPGADAGEAEVDEPIEPEVTGMDAQIRKYFIEGGPVFMGMVLLCLILGLALCIERIIYLNMATTNTTKLLKNVEGALQSGGLEGAKEVCRNTRGPVASIFYQALDRSGGSATAVEKSINEYGGVQMALLERGLSWISLFIAIAPMLGFMGTVIGMIKAFDDIESAGTMNATIVAGGIK
ncbi:MAG: MotA/TolQ/ExbB proton channel family protein, partial [Flavobacteriales bacterium]|nr:MotA/TolQ/ExbB proton channel family protein [Flavobacteriales bacterium]